MIINGEKKPEKIPNHNQYIMFFFLFYNNGAINYIQSQRCKTFMVWIWEKEPILISNHNQHITVLFWFYNNEATY